ncbi:MAG: uroporphyrinogen-III synthase [Alphaproteobacteria bacterium]
MRLLLTRPAQDSVALAAELERRGHTAVVEPMLDIRPLPHAPLGLVGAQAILLTSANGARALLGRSVGHYMPIYAVGNATARAARDAGFSRVESAAGDVEALADLVIARLDPAAGRLVHVAGSAVAGDLAGRLIDAGFDVARAVLYAAEPATALSPACRDNLHAGSLDGALFFSPRSARAFARLVRAADCEDACRRVTGFFLSDAVAVADDLPWRARRIAAEPTQAALLADIDNMDEGG